MTKTPEPSRAHARFASWASWTGMTGTQLGASIGCDSAHVSRIKNGLATPGRRVANAIQRASETWPDGPILASEWDDDCQVHDSNVRRGAEALEVQR